MSYIDEVAYFFLARFPKEEGLSAEEFRRIAEWEKQGIPLSVILHSINELYYGRQREGKSADSIGDCQPYVRANFADWTRRQAAGQ